jgi:hypothetical protein
MGFSQLRNALPDVSSMTGGKKRRTRGRKHSKKSRRGAKRGGFAQIISDAIVPFGLVALTRRKQNRSKSSRKSRKNRRSRRSRR